jgi:hypothetical protein
MNRFELLRGENTEDDALLQTDTMRFVAIMGIVFWIIFTLIKSIPFHESQLDSIPTPVLEEILPLPPVVEAFRPEPEAIRRDRPVRASDTKPVPEKPAPKQVLDSPQPVGIHMQFRSLEDLFDLMKAEHVQIFGRAKTLGFDLFFAGYPQDGAIKFKAVSSLPPKLWEIRSGKDHAYFLSIISSLFPAVRSFPNRQVLVSFNDEGLEGRLEETVGRLEKEGRNGVLSITRSGEILFQRFVPDEEVDGVEKGVVQEGENDG